MLLNNVLFIKWKAKLQKFILTCTDLNLLVRTQGLILSLSPFYFYLTIFNLRD